MEIINIFNENGITLKELMENLVINYCLEIGLFKKTE